MRITAQEKKEIRILELATEIMIKKALDSITVIYAILQREETRYI